MSEMVERVAKALVDADCSAEGLTFKELSLHMARAAIEAMRDPTEPMKEAGELHVRVGHIATEKYKAMINAALNG